MERKYFDDIREFTLPLRDGELVDFRPVRPDDRETIQSGMPALSAQSRRFRFFTPISKLSDAQLRNFTEIDQHDHVAWIALAHDGPEHPGLGVARFIRIQNDPAIAEFAMVVIDSYQQKGLGSILFAVLYRMAHMRSIKILRAFILAENTVMSGWLGKLGAIGVYEENSIIRMELTVSSDLSCLPRNITASRFRNCIERI